MIKTDFLIKALFIFCIGCTVGWIIEVLFRNTAALLAGNPNPINPGFLRGPWLPVYGIGLCTLYLFNEALSAFAISGWLFASLAVAAASVALTVIEYLSGVLSCRVLHARLWDYSNEWGNLEGMICPKFSFFWALISAIYFLVIHESLDKLCEYLLARRYLPLLAVCLFFISLDLLSSVRLSLESGAKGDA